MVVPASGRLGTLRGFIDGLCELGSHAKRSNALAAATPGVVTGASLAVATISQALHSRVGDAACLRACPARTRCSSGPAVILSNGEGAFTGRRESILLQG